MEKTHRKWQQMQLGEIYLGPSRNGVSRPSRVRGTGVKMVNMNELFSYSRIDNPEMELVPMNEKEYEIYSLKKGDLLFARQSLVASGAGKCSVVLSAPEKTTFESHLIRVRIDTTKANPFFYYYYFTSPIGIAKTQSLVMQVAAAGIRASELAKLVVDYPPKCEQDTIVALLEKYDYLIENNSRRIRFLESVVNLIYNEWFTKFNFPNPEKVKMVDSELGKIPKGWEVKKISDVATITKGLSYKSENLVDDGKIAFITLKCIERGGGFRYNGLKRFEGDFKEKHQVLEGDIVMAVTDMTQNRVVVARVARVPRLNENTMIISMDLVKVNAKDNIDKTWLYGLLNYSDFGIKMKEFANGVNVLHLKSNSIEEYSFVLPDEKTRRGYSKIISNIYQQIDVLQLKNLNLTSTRDILLPKLMSGKLDVSELDINVTPVEA